MSVALLVITDGREDYLDQTVLSAMAHLDGPITERYMFDDTGDDLYRATLRERYPQFTHINAGPRQGFGGAIRASWAHLAAHSEARFAWHQEQDFTFDRTIPLRDMAAVLDGNSHLVNLALRRQPWNDIERAAGGIVESRAGEYTERTDGQHHWLEHRLFFTTNPSLYRMELVRKHPWPRGPESEGRFGLELTKSPKVRFGYWGARDSGEWCSHIGHERAGVGF